MNEFYYIHAGRAAGETDTKNNVLTNRPARAPNRLRFPGEEKQSRCVIGRRPASTCRPRTTARARPVPSRRPRRPLRPPPSYEGLRTATCSPERPERADVRLSMSAFYLIRPAAETGTSRKLFTAARPSATDGSACPPGHGAYDFDLT
ncbi:hypothetical protein EVAR_37701_1 [Eumeta japonica]|uniref:Uncharacterized protein n=1 Tax=Eumeta variegata TaxID=151549 RepID=A0A4C1XSM6_EUMVA|nr:hypothetical protein EVAR_37701_1 [Eumeta japonica]